MELQDSYRNPEKTGASLISTNDAAEFNNKTNGITQRRFLMHGNPLLADWVTDKLGTKDWITDLSLMSGLKNGWTMRKL